jgi:hypothetical protein
MRFSGFLENSCNAEIVVAWPRAQFSSCPDPTDAGRAILFGHYRQGGVSRVGGILSHDAKGAKFDAFGAVGITGPVGGTTVGAADGRVSARRSFLANWQVARVVFCLVRLRTYRTPGCVLA